MPSQHAVMPILSFRFKLLLAMMIMVAGVSVTTFFLTQRRVQANYERMFRKQFERQISYFTSLQETRLGAVKDQCLKLSQSVRLLAAMDEKEIPAEILYDITDDELRLLLVSVFQEVRLAGVAGSRRVQATLVRFLDALGKPIPPPEKVRNRFGLVSARKLEQKLTHIQEALDSPERQQVGYLALTIETNRANLPTSNPVRKPGVAGMKRIEETDAPALQEVIVTKLVDPENNHTVGALVLGFPLAELVPLPKTNSPAVSAKEIEPIQTGILLESHLYANPGMIPQSMGLIVEENVSRRIESTKKLRDEFDCVIESKHYRIFYDLMNRGSGFPPAYQVCLYSMEEAQREQRDLRLKVLGASGVGLTAALLAGLVLSHSLSVPLRELVAGTREIERGNFAVKVPVRSRDEIGQLAASFNDMTQGLAQKERYRTVLNQMADEKVAQQLISGEITLGGELRDVSVLFCDIRGFTALTQTMPPNQVIEMLNEHMTVLTRVVKQHNGVLDKFVGDLLMAIFGAPVSHGNDTFDAARCAVQLIEERDRLNQTSKYKLQIGIGLATGKVVAGCMGSADRMNYTVLGERVNLASRLCDSAEPGEIVIDQPTAEALQENVTVQPVSAVQLKGFAAPVRVYKITTVNSTAPKA